MGHLITVATLVESFSQQIAPCVLLRTYNLVHHRIKTSLFTEKIDHWLLFVCCHVAGIISICDISPTIGTWQMVGTCLTMSTPISYLYPKFFEPVGSRLRCRSHYNRSRAYILQSPFFAYLPGVADPAPILAVQHLPIIFLPLAIMNSRFSLKQEHEKEFHYRLLSWRSCNWLYSVYWLGILARLTYTPTSACTGELPKNSRKYSNCKRARCLAARRPWIRDIVCLPFH